MHCPRCGQQQISEETKFCSRCGFSLGLVSEILANGGSLPQLADLYKSKGFTRRNGIIAGGIWMFVWVLLITPIIAISGGEEIAGIGGVLGIFGGILIMMLSAFFLKPAPKLMSPNFVSAATINQLNQPNNQQALPPQQSIPADAYVSPAAAGKWRETNDLVQPPSVTDGTTKLLEKDIN